MQIFNIHKHTFDTRSQLLGFLLEELFCPLLLTLGEFAVLDDNDLGLVVVVDAEVGDGEALFVVEDLFLVLNLDFNGLHILLGLVQV